MLSQQLKSIVGDKTEDELSKSDKKVCLEELCLDQVRRPASQNLTLTENGSQIVFLSQKLNLFALFAIVLSAMCVQGWSMFFMFGPASLFLLQFTSLIWSLTSAVIASTSQILAATFYLLSAESLEKARKLSILGTSSSTVETKHEKSPSSTERTESGGTSGEGGSREA